LEEENKLKKTIHRAETRGFFDHGWLKTYHTFSFASYFDPERVRFGLLRVLNDDIIEPGMGFGTHPHENMEIVTIPLKGELAHKDSMGTKQVIKSGEIQAMSAGSGLTHSEFNNSNTDLVNLLQIWVFPKVQDIEPRYEQKVFNTYERKNKFQTVVSPEKGNGAMWINQDAYFSLAELDKEKDFNYRIKHNGNGAYIFLIEGAIKTEGETLNKRDGIGIEGIQDINIKALESSEILLIEVPMHQ
jgi:redox-sensitive bicupin YhaK (pirin superfamily)